MSAQPARKPIRLLSAIEHMPTGGTLIVPDVAWEDYEGLLTELNDSSRVRVSYDQGRLEIVSPLSKHEKNYAGLGVPEVWRYDEKRLQIHHLTNQGYVEAPASRAFPFLTGEALTEFLERSKTEKQRAVLKSFRKWVQTHRPKMP
jgi:Uma2 family endonuclease